MRLRVSVPSSEEDWRQNPFPSRCNPQHRSHLRLLGKDLSVQLWSMLWFFSVLLMDECVEGTNSRFVSCGWLTVVNARTGSVWKFFKFCYSICLALSTWMSWQQWHQVAIAYSIVEKTTIQVFLEGITDQDPCNRLGRHTSLILRSCFLKTSSATTWWERMWIQAFNPWFRFISRRGSSEYIGRENKKVSSPEGKGSELPSQQFVACDVWTYAIMLGLFWRHSALFNPVPSRILPIFPWDIGGTAPGASAKYLGHSRCFCVSWFHYVPNLFLYSVSMETKWKSVGCRCRESEKTWKHWARKKAQGVLSSWSEQENGIREALPCSDFRPNLVIAAVGAAGILDFHGFFWIWLWPFALCK